jgi:hypothetical protein
VTASTSPALAGGRSARADTGAALPGEGAAGALPGAAGTAIIGVVTGTSPNQRGAGGGGAGAICAVGAGTTWVGAGRAGAGALLWAGTAEATAISTQTPRRSEAASSARGVQGILRRTGRCMREVSAPGGTGLTVTADRPAGTRLGTVAGRLAASGRRGYAAGLGADWLPAGRSSSTQG